MKKAVKLCECGFPQSSPVPHAHSVERATAPWAEEKRAKMRADKVADPEASPMTWLLANDEELRHLVNGDVPEELAYQAEIALKGPR